MNAEPAPEERVLVLAPTPADAALTENILREAGFTCHVCADTRDLSRELRLGAGTVLVTEEVYSSRDVFYLVEAIRGQADWSDIPVLLLASSGADSSAAAWAMEMLGNVTVLERPIRVTTLVSALSTALRARRRQYQLHEQIEALQKSEERLRLAIEFGKLGLWEWDIEKDEIHTLHFARDLPVPAPHLTAKESVQMIHPDDRERVWDMLQAALRGGDHFDVEFRLCDGDGALRWLTSKGELIRDRQGDAVRMLGVNYDITARKQGEEVLREADHRKDKFLATLAHELRNPLAPIRNALQVMRLAHNDPGVIEQARVMMERQLSQMVRLIDDLLDVSRISTGKLELRKELVLLRDIIGNAVDTARPIIEAANHTLHIDLPNEPIYLEADPMRLAQVFANLLNNAAKYTDQGGDIWLDASRHDDVLSVRVRDTGMGIPAEALSSVFEMFTQLDPSLSKSQGGLGIGLMLVKQLVGMHGGSIEARSEGAGKGAEFTVRVPIVPALQAPSASAEERIEETPARCRILVADDNCDAAESMGMMLQMMGNEVRTVYDGLQALEVADEFRPHLVLLDIGMPLLNGYETAQRIRERAWGREMRLVAITGWGQDGDKRLAVQAGFDRHFTKPVHPSEVIKLIAEFRKEPPCSTAAWGAEAHTPLRHGESTH